MRGRERRTEDYQERNDTEWISENALAMGLAMGDVDALMRAATDGDVEHVRKLLDGGCYLLSRDVDGQTALFHAALAGKVDVVRLLLERDGDHTLVNLAGSDGGTPLLAACKGGFGDVLDELLSHGADGHARVQGGLTALHLVSVNGHASLVEPLLGREICVDVTDDNVWTALHFASHFGHVDVVKQLLSNGASIGLCDSLGQTVLLLAAVEGKMDVVQVLLERDVDRTLVNLRRKTDGWTPLFAAGAGGHGDVFEKLLKHSGLTKEQLLQDASGPFGHAGVLKQLLAHGADPNISNMMGATPLRNAAACGRVDLVKELLSTGRVDPNIPDQDGWTPLHWAARNGNIDVVSALTSSSVAGIRADPYAREKAFGRTPLHIAAEEGRVDVVKALLSNKVDPNVPDKGGATALHLAAYNDYPDVVKSLLECEVTVVDVKTSNREFIYTTTCADDDFERWEAKSKTALHLAAERGYTKVVDALLQYRANVNERDADSNTALHHVTKFSRLRDSDDNCYAIAMALLEHGADEESRNQALCFASWRDEYDMVKLLLECEEKSDVNTTIWTTGAEEWTALHCASSAGNVKVVELLLDEKEVRTSARDKSGKTPLHVACEKNHSEVVKTLLADDRVDKNILDNAGCSALHWACYSGSVEAVNELLSVEGIDLDQQTAVSIFDVVERALGADGTRDGMTPLALCFQLKPLERSWRDKEKVFWNALETAHVLLSFGVTYDGPSEIFPSVEEDHKDRAATVSMCVRHWTEEQQHKKKLLTNVPFEVFQRGSKAVETYLTELDASDEKDRVWRRKVCVVGSSKAGKTSMIKSITSMTPTLEKDDDRTIGVDLFRLEFKEDIKSGSTVEQRSHAVTFWDFAGQDEYHVAHTLFFSPRTLYLLCVDVKEFDEVVRKAHACEDEDEAESLVLAFVQEHVWRWIRLIFARQPDAEFVLIATKTDALSGDAHSRLNDLESELFTDVAELKQTNRREIQREIDALLELSANDKTESSSDTRIESLRALQVQLESSVPTSWIGLNVLESSSIQHARACIEDVVKQSGRSFEMPDKYSRVLHKVEVLRQKARDAKMKHRIQQSFVSLPDLVKVLMADIHDLTEDDAKTILAALHDLGDVLWYARDGHHMLGDTIILDAELLIDIIRQIVCHDPTKISGAKNLSDCRDDPLLQAMNLHGKIADDLLKYKFTLWRRLAYPEQMLQFKKLLQHFNLAYPAEEGEMQGDSDLIVPAYWRMRAQPTDLEMLEPLSIRDTKAMQVMHFHWEYDFGGNFSDVVETVFEQLAVRSYRVFPGREIGGYRSESVRNRRLAIRISCGIVGKRGPVIRFEVVGSCDQKPSIWLRDLHLATEDVLKVLHGVVVTRKAVVGDTAWKLDELVPKLRGMPIDRQALTLPEYPWLPDHALKWFRHHDWVDGPSEYSEQQANATKNQNQQQDGAEADSLGLRRRIPCCWTLEFSTNSQAVLRIHSELTGKTHHQPIKIFRLSENFKINDVPIENVVNLFVGTIPIGIAKKMIDGFKENVRSWKVFSASKALPSEYGAVHYVHPDKIDDSLLELLRTTFRNSARRINYTELSSCCELVRAFNDSTGTRLWVHPTEMSSDVSIWDQSPLRDQFADPAEDDDEPADNNETDNSSSKNSLRSNPISESAVNTTVGDHSSTGTLKRVEHSSWFLPQDNIVKDKNAVPFAAGGFGRVYLAKWGPTDVVMKEILNLRMNRFINEVELWCSLRHPNVVPFYGANDRSDPCFIVSGYATRGELIPFLQQEKTRGRSITWRKLVEFAVGLDYLHGKGIVHGDLKGNNILVNTDGTAMLADFGLSFIESESCSVVAETKETLGTMAWRAPEFIDRPIRKSDVYSLGMCMIEAVTGENPLSGYTSEEIRAHHREGRVVISRPKSKVHAQGQSTTDPPSDLMTDAQWELVQQMTAHSPGDRPQLSYVISKLEEFAKEEQDIENKLLCPYD